MNESLTSNITNTSMPGPLIPPPAAIRERLYRLRHEVRFLARLLRVSEAFFRSSSTQSTSSAPESKEVARG